jgi:RNA polymerase sigma-70 factor (ECF subfamily)
MTSDEPPDQIDVLFRAAWALCGERDRAEDLVAATYARTLLQPPALRRGDERARMFAELRRTLTDARREERRSVEQPGAPQPLEEPEGPAETPAPAAEGGLDPRAVYSTVARLPEELRDVLVAVDVAGLGRRQAAKALRLRDRDLDARLERARAELARSLGAPPA